MFKIKIASKFLSKKRKILEEKLLDEENLTKLNFKNYTKMKIIGTFMDLRMWFYFNKKHLAVSFGTLLVEKIFFN